MRDPDENALLQHADFLRALARGLLADASQADDVVQETWVRALEQPLRSRHNLRGWLGVVARNLALRVGRSTKRRVARERSAVRPDRLPSADEVAARAELQRRIAAAVEELQEPYRSAVHHRYFDGLTPAEIAERLDMPVKTVKTRLYRALEMLRARLDRECGGRKAWSIVLLGLVLPRGTAAAATGVVMAGGAILMKKTIAVVSILVVAALLVWSSRSETQQGERAEKSATMALPAAETETSADPGTAPASQHVLREDDAVPAFTFAGRVVDRDGEGIPRARVRLVYWNPQRGDRSGSTVKLVRRDAERQRVVAGPTNDEGYFRFDRPYPSRSYLRVDAEGYPTAITGPYVPGNFILVTLGEHVSLHVRVESPDGEPVERCRVRLVSKSGARQVFALRTTDKSGTVSLPRPPDWNFLIEADPTDPSLGFAGRGLDNQSEVVIRVPRVKTHDFRIVDAVSGAPLGDAYILVFKQYRVAWPSHQRVRRRFVADQDGVVRVPLQKGYVSFFASAPGYEMTFAGGDPIKLRRSAEVHGFVLDPAGIPVPDVPLLVLLPDHPLERCYFGLPLAAGRTDAQGRFDLEIKVLKPTWGRGPPDPGVRTLVAFRGADAPAILDSVAAQPGTRQRVTLRFPRQATLDIEVVDVDGNPIAEQWLQLGRRLPRPDNWSHRSESWGFDLAQLQNRPPYRTDESGRFTVEGLAPGLYTVRVGTTQVTKDIREGVREKLRLVRGATPGIDVHALDRAGKPLAGVVVSLSGADATSKKTDERGHVSFLDLKPGTYKVSVRVEAWNGVFSREAKPGDTVELQIPEGPARLRVVVDGPPAETVEYALVTATGAWPKKWWVKLKDSLTTPFAPGAGVLMVRAKGYGKNAVRFRAPAAETTEVRVALPRAGRVEGHVRVPEGSKELVRLIREGGYPYTLAGQSPWMPYALQTLQLVSRPDKEGRFAIGEVHPAVYRASLGHFDNAKTIQDRKWIERKGVDIEVMPGETVTIDLR